MRVTYTSSEMEDCHFLGWHYLDYRFGGQYHDEVQSSRFRRCELICLTWFNVNIYEHSSAIRSQFTCMMDRLSDHGNRKFYADELRQTGLFNGNDC